jgi:hypothetical protein
MQNFPLYEDFPDLDGSYVSKNYPLPARQLISIVEHPDSSKVIVTELAKLYTGHFSEDTEKSDIETGAFREKYLGKDGKVPENMDEELTFQLSVSIKDITKDHVTYSKRWTKSFYGFDWIRSFHLKEKPKNLMTEISDCGAYVSVQVDQFCAVLDINDLSELFQKETHMIRRLTVISEKYSTLVHKTKEENKLVFNLLDTKTGNLLSSQKCRSNSKAYLYFPKPDTYIQVSRPF